MRTGKIIILVVLVIILAITLVDPLYPHEMMLQHSATLMAFIFMLWSIWKRVLTLPAYACFAGFILLHIIGARWIYSLVPYDDWVNAIFGFRMDETFGWERNHYDRFVHLCFGLLYMLPVFELFRRKHKAGTALLLAFLGVQFGSLIYELFEWSLTLMVSDEKATNYNGQQGDMWDAHKDMTLALLGSLISLVVIRFSRFDRKARD